PETYRDDFHEAMRFLQLSRYWRRGKRAFAVAMVVLVVGALGVAWRVQWNRATEQAKLARLEVTRSKTLSSFAGANQAAKGQPLRGLILGSQALKTLQEGREHRTSGSDDVMQVLIEGILIDLLKTVGGTGLSVDGTVITTVLISPDGLRLIAGCG